LEHQLGDEKDDLGLHTFFVEEALGEARASARDGATYWWPTSIWRWCQDQVGPWNREWHHKEKMEDKRRKDGSAVVEVYEEYGLGTKEMGNEVMVQDAKEQ
jgi:hypothetical protein